MRSPIDKSATPSEKLDFIFSHICNYQNPTTGRRNNEGGIDIDLGASYMHLDHNYVGLNSYPEMVFYLHTLEHQGLILLDKRTLATRSAFGNINVDYPPKCRLTFKGLSYLADLENKGALSNKCFIAMPFDTKKTERLNAIKQACSAHHFDAFIVEEYKAPGNQTIDAKIIAAIKSSRFCIVDFTGLNAGAYLEAGFAMGRDMKVIFICEKKDFNENKKHFDVNHYPFLCYTDFSHLTTLLIDEIGAYIA